jgi:hypothetical protein
VGLELVEVCEAGLNNVDGFDFTPNLFCLDDCDLLSKFYFWAWSSTTAIAFIYSYGGILG